MEHYLTAAGIVIGIDNRIIPCRVLGNTGDDGSFREGKLAHILAEVPVGGRLHSVAAGTEVYSVQVVFQNLILGKQLFKLDGQILLLDFALQPL